MSYRTVQESSRESPFNDDMFGINSLAESGGSKSRDHGRDTDEMFGIDSLATDYSPTIEESVSENANVSEYSRQFSNPATVHERFVPNSTYSHDLVCCVDDTLGPRPPPPDIAEPRKGKVSEYCREFGGTWTGNDVKNQYEINSKVRQERKMREFSSAPLEWAELSDEMNNLLKEVDADNVHDASQLPTPRARRTTKAQAGDGGATRKVSSSVRKALGIKNGGDADDVEVAASSAVQKKRSKEAQIFAPFGCNNTTPTVPSFYMKTHNARAPENQLIPFTTERVSRAKQYDEDLKRRKQKHHDRLRKERFANLQRKEEKGGADNLTEYQRGYKDWRNYSQSPSGQWVKK